MSLGEAIKKREDSRLIVLKAIFFPYTSWFVEDDLIFSCLNCQFYKSSDRRQARFPVALISTNIDT